MSWVFALLMCLYGCAWLGLYARGRWRWFRSDLRHAIAPVAEATPKFLDPTRRELFVEAQALQAVAWAHAHLCARVRLTDPDVRFTGTRSGAFRRVSVQGAQQVRAFCSTLRNAAAQDATLFAGHADLLAAFDAVQATLDAHARVVSKARALEAFPVPFCDGTQRAFDQAQRLAGDLCDIFARRSLVDPYRPGRNHARASTTGDATVAA